MSQTKVSSAHLWSLALAAEGGREGGSAGVCTCVCVCVCVCVCMHVCVIPATHLTQKLQNRLLLVESSGGH